MIRLVETAFGTLRSLLPPGRDAAAWHAALCGEIGQHLSPAHAQILARPEPTAGGITWLAGGSVRSRYADLPAEGRRALDAAIGAILSDVRRLAESGVASAVQEAWPAIFEVPDMGHVFAVDGRPVLAAWGHAGGAGGRLARLDDGVPWRAAPRPPWGRYGAALGVLAGFALAAGLLLPLAPRWLVNEPAACAIVPGQLEALRGQMELDGRGQELRTLLATLTEEVGRAQLLCPIVVLRPLPSPAPASIPSPPAALPQNRWDQHDLGVLSGCWSLYTPVVVSNATRTQSSKVQSWRMCFNNHGTGQQTVTLEDGRGCQGPLSAGFAGEGFLRVTHPAPCISPALEMVRAGMLCQRLNDSEAACEVDNLDGAFAGSSYASRFRR